MPPVSNQQPVRLRDLRDTAVPRDKSEVRAPTRRPKFEDSLKHEKAGEVVGEFPPKFDKGLSKQTLKRSALQVGASRVEQVHENMKSAEFVEKLTPEIMDKIDAVFGVVKKGEDDD